MMAEANDFTADIRSALGFSSTDKRDPGQLPTLFSSTAIDGVLDRIYSRTIEEKRLLVAQFKEQAAPLKLIVHETAGFSGAARIVADIINDSSPEFGEAQEIILHDHADIAALQLAIKDDSGIVYHCTSPTDPAIRQKTIASYIGITAPQWGVADTATVLQVTKTGQPRSTSLVPSIHIGVLRLENMLADLSELYALLKQNPPDSSYVFISGPSKTADIESQLVHGAHGPKEMHIVVAEV
ncbi:MAG: LUD domain-containing protein [Desulfobacterales bacterium]|nr:LUD domain-containing protein [Deltaproteobacteria bacterium]NNK97343.1 LUD domain-containing protein [Desulfobacterales bacterium]